MVKGIKISIVDKKFATNINKAFVEQLNTVVAKMIKDLHKKIEPIIFNIIEGSEIYQSLVYGELNAHFGFPKGSAKDTVDAIVQKMSKSISIDFKPYRPLLRKNFSGRLRISISREDFSDVLGLIESTILVTSKKGAYELPWLEWLLHRGSEVIVFGYQFIPMSVPYSRSGGGVMVKNEASFWRVPSEYAGTPGDNWITKLLKNNITFLSNEIGNIVKREIESRLR